MTLPLNARLSSPDFMHQTHSCCFILDIAVDLVRRTFRIFFFYQNKQNSTFRRFCKLSVALSDDKTQNLFWEELTFWKKNTKENTLTPNKTQQQFRWIWGSTGVLFLQRSVMLLTFAKCHRQESTRSGKGTGVSKARGSLTWFNWTYRTEPEIRKPALPGRLHICTEEIKRVQLGSFSNVSCWLNFFILVSVL